jgi:hypothetical protein
MGLVAAGRFFRRKAQRSNNTIIFYDFGLTDFAHMRRSQVAKFFGPVLFSPIKRQENLFGSSIAPRLGRAILELDDAAVKQ